MQHQNKAVTACTLIVVLAVAVQMAVVGTVQADCTQHAGGVALDPPECDEVASSATMAASVNPAGDATLAAQLGSDISISSFDRDFGDVSVGSAGTKTITVSNEGNDTVVVDNVSFDGVDADAFSASRSSFTLGPGESRSVSLTFEPTRTGIHSASLTVVSDALSIGSVTLPVSGTGIAGELSVVRKQLSFRQTRVDAQDSRTLTLVNAGRGSLTIEDVSLDGEDADQFRVTNVSDTIEAGERGELSVTFAPSREGDANATLVVNTTDPDDPTVEVGLAGTGTRLSLRTTPSEYDFGTVPIGESAETNVTVENNGTGRFIIAGMRIVGDGTPAFRIVGGDTGGMLNETNALNVTVAFTPRMQGNKSATLQILGKNGTQLTAVSLDGAAAAPDVRVERHSLTFADATVNETSTKSLTVENRGNAPLVVDDQSIKPADRGFELRDPIDGPIAPGETETLTVAFTPDSRRPTSAVLSLTTNDPTERTVPVFLTSTRATVNVSVETSENATALDASVRNATGGEAMSIAVPDDPERTENATVDQVAVTPKTNGSFELNVTSSEEKLESSPEFEANASTKPADLGYMKVDHSISNDNISQASITYRVSKSRMAEMQSEPEDFTLYRYHNGSWTAVNTTLVEETNESYVFRGTATGFSEWTAAVEVPRINVTDATANVTAVTTQETVDIQVLLNNTGGSDGRFETKLLLNGSVVERRDVAVSPASTSLVNFRRGFDQAGTYQVRVNDVFVAAIDVSSTEREAKVTERTEQVPSTPPSSSSQSSSSPATTTGGTGPLSPVLALLSVALAGFLARAIHHRRE